MADGERPPGPQAQRRLGVLPDRRAGGRVPAVRDREVARAATGSAARRGPGPPCPGPCRSSGASPSETPTPADSWPRCWSANSAVAATAAASWPRLGRTTPTTPHISRRPRRPGARHRRRGRRRRSPSQPSARGSPCVPRVAQVRHGDVEGVRDPAPALLGGARGALAGEIDDAGGRRRSCPARPRAGRAARASSSNAGTCRAARPRTTRRDGLSPNSATAGESPDREPQRAPRARPRCTSRRPPPRTRRADTSWQLSTSPRAIASRMNAWRRRSRSRSSGGGPSSGRGAGQALVLGAGEARGRPGRPAGPRCRRARNAGPDARRDVRRAAPRCRSRAWARSRTRAPRCRARRCRRSRAGPGRCRRRRGRGRPRRAARTPPGGWDRRS